MTRKGRIRDKHPGSATLATCTGTDQDLPPYTVPVLKKNFKNFHGLKNSLTSKNKNTGSHQKGL
jgi:hypothetical protein